MLDGLYERSPWIVDKALSARPFKSLPHLKAALTQVVNAATTSEQLSLLRAHPELAGKAMQDARLTAESNNEQSIVGLTQCTPEELETISQLNRAYKEKFGFPFLLAVRGTRGNGLSKKQIIDTFNRRLLGHPMLN